MNDTAETTATVTRSLEASTPSHVTGWKKFGPLALVMAMIGAVGVYLVTTDPVATSVDATANAVDKGPQSTADIAVLPPGVETFDRAKKKGIADTIDWGDRCDTSTGRLKIPLWPQADCFKPFTGDNGGSVSPGVTRDEILVVLFREQSNDPILKFVYAQIGNTDTPEGVLATFDGFTEIFNRYYELYGRKVKLVPYVATGSTADPVAAAADAETIARDIKPFAVIGGPRLTDAFADTLAKNKVLCIGCAPAEPSQWYEERSPYMWDVLKNADQALWGTAEYLGKRVFGYNAKYAGDPSMHNRKRVVGLVAVKASESAQALQDRFTGRLKDEFNAEFAEIQTYVSPTDLAGSGKDIITKLKEAGVTTVVFVGDPLGPQYLTKIATTQNYFPEWVVGPSTLVDTAIFSRTYDQKQWAHAFGPTNLFARSSPETVGPGYLYKWYFGTRPPAPTTVPLISGPLQVLFGALQGAGPGLSPEMFKRVLFGSPVIPSSPVNAQVSFGNKGFYDDPDYSGLDDQTEFWWDPDAEGLSETGQQGKGLWRYVDGGKRFLPGEWPAKEAKLFDPKGTVTIYQKPPPGTELPEYKPLR